MERLLEVPDLGTTLGVRDRAIMELLYSSAIRNKELCNIETKDLDMDNQTLYILGNGDREDILNLKEER